MTDNDSASSVIRLPLGETLKRSFLYIALNFKDCVKIASFWYLLVVIDILLGFPSLSESLSVQSQFNRLASALLMSVGYAAIAVCLCRGIILRENDYRYFKPALDERIMRYWGYNILITLLMVLPMVAIVFFQLKSKELLGGAGALLSLVLIIIVGIVVARLYLVLPAKALDRKDFSLASAWRLTAGDRGKIFLGVFVMAIPGMILVMLLSALNTYFGSADSFVYKIIFSLLSMSISFIDTCFKVSFLSHAYQYYVYYKEHQ